MLSTSILCVDDRESCCNLSDILRDAGYTVAVASSTSEALRLLGVQDYRVGLFASDTPEVDWQQLWQRMKHGPGKRACILLTEDLPTAELFHAAKMCGVRAILVKPLDIARLLRLLEEEQPCQRVLVVDNNPELVSSFSLFLALTGHEVHTARDGLAALAAMRSFRPQIVFIDIDLPCMSGCELALRVRQTPGLERVRLIALTENGQEREPGRFQEVGFEHHLVKPVAPETVLRLLARD
jgi:CheY-like chemotaxis protein